MKIPNSFKLFGETINVIFKDDLTFEEDTKGMTQYRRSEIILQTKENGRPQVQVEQTFFHELTHWILHRLRQDELCNDEQFVSTLANLLHQALNSFKYDQPNKKEK